MDNVLICEVTSFALQSTLHFPDGTSHKLPTADLPKYLLSTCKAEGITKVKFACDNSAYVEGLIAESKSNEMTQYGINNIEYEVI